MPSDYTQLWRIYGASNADIDLPTILPLLTAKSATRIIRVQRIMFAPTIYAPSVYSAGVISFVDSISGLSIGTLTIPGTAPSSGFDMFQLDFGPKGTPLTVGANLLLGVITPGSAPTGRLHIDAYQAGR